MFFKYQDSKFCVNCDWLSFSVHLREPEPEIMCPDGLRIELCQGNNVFEHRAMVFDSRGAKYLTLLWKPYSKVLPANLMTCQLANEFLYLPAGQGIKWAFEDLQRIVDCTFNAVGRIDICIDWEANDNRLEFLKHLNSGHYYAQHKSEGSTWWHEVSNGDYKHKQLHCLTWGSPKSEIKVKIYHKSREQGLINGDTPEKPWIIEEWKQNGMDIRNVWRLEFSMQGAGQLRYKGQPIQLANVQDEFWLLNVLCELYANRFVTRINQGKRNGHKNLDQRVYLFQLPPKAAGLKWAEPKGKDYELPASITLLRSLMRQVDNPVVMASRPMFEEYAYMVIHLVEAHKLDGYFRRTYQEECRAYFDTMWENVGQGIRQTTPSPARLMD